MIFIDGFRTDVQSVNKLQYYNYYLHVVVFYFKNIQRIVDGTKTHACNWHAIIACSVSSIYLSISMII